MAKNLNKSIIRFKEVRHIKNPVVLAKSIYNDFLYLSEYEELQHNLDEIVRLLTNDNFIGFFAFNQENKMIGYLVGEEKRLSDSRIVYYISYPLVKPEYRKHKIGKKLMNNAINMCSNTGYAFIILICDTENKVAMNFYHKYGFIPDPLIRRNDRHEVLCLYL